MHDHPATGEGCKRGRVGSGFAERRGTSVEDLSRDRALGGVKDASRAELKPEGGDRNVDDRSAGPVRKSKAKTSILAPPKPSASILPKIAIRSLDKTSARGIKIQFTPIGFCFIAQLKPPVGNFQIKKLDVPQSAKRGN
jgi:hypothetical protein